MPEPSVVTAIAQAEHRVIQKAKDTLAHHGFVVHREKSWRQLVERVRVADALRVYAQGNEQRTRDWATELHNQIRDLMARCTYLYGTARAKGATADELAGGWTVVGTDLPTEVCTTMACRECGIHPYIIQIRDGRRHITKFVCPQHGWVATERREEES